MSNATQGTATPKAKEPKYVPKPIDEEKLAEAVAGVKDPESRALLEEAIAYVRAMLELGSTATAATYAWANRFTGGRPYGEY